jgi:hypothetical protein
MCIGEMARKAKADPNFIITCCHCFSQDFRLEDVQPSSEIKFYTDTPFKNKKHSPEKTLPELDSPKSL